MEIPITETSNQITTTIDIASSHGMYITTELSRYIVSSKVYPLSCQKMFRW
jgi:hypothetical protein